LINSYETEFTGRSKESDGGISCFVNYTKHFQKPLHNIEDILIRVAKICLCQDGLTAEELPYVSQAFPKRVREFTAGRHIARRTLRQMNVATSSIPVGKNRLPVWPDGIVGSISHTDDIVGVALARAKDYVSVGFDIETGGSVKHDLFDMIMTDSEREYLDLKAKPELATHVFSCKESVYKAVYPIVGEFLEFRDLEVRIANGRFEAGCTADARSNIWVGVGKGFIETDGDLVKTLFVIER